jgi:tetratricopeptide (TPR) repeat protein
MRRLGLVLLVGSLIISACAPKVIPAPVITTPKYPDFILPQVPPALSGNVAAVTHDRAWRFLQNGDLPNAEHELTTALLAAPDFFPSEAAAGYLEMAKGNAEAAIDRFDRALARQADYAPALAGRGQALLSLGRDDDAIAAFSAAYAADSSLGNLPRQVEVLKFRQLERSIEAARQAAKSNRLDEASRAYQAAIARSPESAFLYRELATVERRRQNDQSALDYLRQSIVIDPNDAGAHAQVAELLEASGNLQEALTEYEAAIAIERSDALEAKRDGIKAKIEFDRLPEEYRTIPTAPQINRAQLAALIGIQLPQVVQAMGASSAVVITDVRSSWAEPWIMPVARAGVIEAFANHTFQPDGVIRRSDLAAAVSRMLSAIGTAAQTKVWESARTRFTDLAPTHLVYPAASVAVASGVMTTDGDGSFQQARAVTGAEAVDAIQRLARLASPPTGASIRR